MVVKLRTGLCVSSIGTNGKDQLESRAQLRQVKSRRERGQRTNSATSLELPLSDSLCVLDSSLSFGRLSLLDDVFEVVFFFSGSMAEAVFRDSCAVASPMYVAGWGEELW